MDQPGLHRRGFAAALAATVFTPGLGRTAVFEVRPGGASRLGPVEDSYEPPAKLSAVLDIYKRMTAPVTVNGQGPYPFVADTGANQSVISAELAQALGLALCEARPLNGVAGVQVTPTVNVKVQVGSRPERDHATLFVLAAADIGGPGMLGLDQLDGGRLTLDFQRQTLTVDASAYLPGDGAEVALRAQRRDGQLTLVDADLAGVHVTAFLDSGAQNTIGNMALRQLATTRYPAAPWTHTPIVSVTGQTIDADFADLPSLRIGGFTMPNWPIAFADLYTFQMWGMTRRPAILLGVDVMSRFATICLDFRRDEVRFRLPNRA